MLRHRGQLKIVGQRLIGPARAREGSIMVMTISERMFSVEYRRPLIAAEKQRERGRQAWKDVVSILYIYIYICILKIAHLIKSGKCRRSVQIERV